jgi:hypothetical protein
MLPLNKFKNSLKRLLPLEMYSVHTSDITTPCGFPNIEEVEPLVNLRHQRFFLIFCSISMIPRQQSMREFPSNSNIHQLNVQIHQFPKKPYMGVHT